jgi:hypothetical protein
MMNANEWLLENGRYHTIGKDVIFSIGTKDMEQYAEYIHNELSKLHLDAVIGCSHPYKDIIEKEYGDFCDKCGKYMVGE